MTLRALMPAVVALMLGACATPPIDATGADAALRPAEAVAAFPGSRGSVVVWGGVIVSSENLPAVTRLEVLGYPLNSGQRPRIDRGQLGRFLVAVDGYLETATYRAGRQLTVRGMVADVVDGRVGEAAYRFPVLRAQRLYLWPPERAAYPPRVHFGVGVVIGN